MSLTLHYFTLSEPSNLILALLKHFNIEAEKKLVNLATGEQRQEEYLKNVNPFGKVPAITEGDFWLNESISICRYLIQSRASSTDFYPYDDIRKLAKVNSLIDHDLMTYRHNIDTLVMMVAVGPVFLGWPLPTAEQHEKYKEDAAKSYESLKFVLDLNGGPYLAGEHLTLADFTHYFTTIGAIYLAEDTTIEKYPEVHAWFKRIEEIDSVAEIMKEYKENSTVITDGLHKLQNEKS